MIYCTLYVPSDKDLRSVRAINIIKKAYAGDTSAYKIEINPEQKFLKFVIFLDVVICAKP